MEQNSKTEKCTICGTESAFAFTHPVLEKYPASFYKCPHCGLLFTPKPTWLSEAYDSAITAFDTGILARNLQFRDTIAPFLYLLFGADGTYLDYGGGYGTFVRLMRDYGFDFYWTDKYCQNLLAPGFAYKNQPISLVTAFEIFEHFENPLDDIEKMFSLCSSVIFSTELLQTPVPPLDWWYYCFEHGQHLTFYARETLEYIAQERNLHYVPLSSNLHLITDKNPETIRSILKKMQSKKMRRNLDSLLPSKTMDDFYFCRNLIQSAKSKN